MGYISIFLVLAVVITLMIRRWSPLMVGLAASAVVIFTNGLPYGGSMTDLYFEGFCTMFKSLFPVIFSGSLLAQIYNRSGAVNAIGDAMANALFKDGTSPTRRYVSCILTMVAASGVLAYCGMNSLVTLIAMYPIALRLMERAGVPKRFVMGILSCGVYTFAMSGPGSAEVVNILAMDALGTTSYAGLCGGYHRDICHHAPYHHYDQKSCCKRRSIQIWSQGCRRRRKSSAPQRTCRADTFADAGGTVQRFFRQHIFCNNYSLAYVSSAVFHVHSSQERQPAK